MQGSLEECACRPKGVVQAISMMVVAAMFCLSLRPLAAAAQTRELPSSPVYRYLPPLEAPSAGSATTSFPLPGLLPTQGAAAGRCQAVTPVRPPTVDEQYINLLDGLKTEVKHAKAQSKRGLQVESSVKGIRAHAKNLDALDAAIDASFKATEQELRDKNLPPVLLERHRLAVRQFKARQGQFKELLQQFVAADDKNRPAEREAVMEKLLTFFAQHRQGDTHRPVDLKELPFRKPSGEVRAPAAKLGELPPALFGKDGSRMAAQSQAESQRSPLEASVAPPAAGDLAPTEDVEFTQPIKDLAASLQNNPVKIYNWVHNNIQWLPTYGSVQGSDMTLLTRRGNAFDISSLLIALYRSAGIPARYVYGTIEVPASQVMNWVGGVSRPEAAQQLMGQGGIPNIALVNGGVVQSIQLEHVWVEAFVDYVPSRGAINLVPDTWVPMDPSFKQYEFVAPVDLQSNVAVDIETAAAQIASTAVVDQQIGSITGFDQATYDDWTLKMREDIGYRFGQDLKVSDFTGSRKILAQESSVLASTLANEVIVRMGSFSRVPDGLRYRLTLNLYATEYDRVLGEPSASYSISLPKMAGKRLGVTYVPATAADATALASYRNSAGDSLPVYLLNVRPVVQLDGINQVEGPSGTMGQGQVWEVRLFGPGGTEEHQHDYNVTAGDELVWGVDANGVSEAAIHRRFLQQPSDTAAENLYTVSLYYWAQYDAMDEAVATTSQVVSQRLPSIGLFSAPLEVQYTFGIPRLGYYSSRTMDVSHSLVGAVQKANGSTAEFHRLSGTVGSLLEGRTFDGIFRREPGSGVSSVQLLREANQQRIPIHLLTEANYAAIEPRLDIDPDTRAEIANAIQAGKQVIVSERPPIHGSWLGLGYIIEDPETGAAAYLIKGGLNGGTDGPCDPEKKKEPVRVPVLELVLIALLIIALILLLIYMPQLIILIGRGLAGLGSLGRRLIPLFGIGAATPALAQAPPTYPGDGMVPPGDCTWAQHNALSAAVHQYCHGAPSCKQYPKRGANCALLQQAKERNVNCALARTTINTTCFRGGSRFHRAEELIAYDRIVCCELRLMQNGCPP